MDNFIHYFYNMKNGLEDERILDTVFVECEESPENILNKAVELNLKEFICTVKPVSGHLNLWEIDVTLGTRDRVIMVLTASRHAGKIPSFKVM